jgi:hypothetical protein
MTILSLTILASVTISLQIQSNDVSRILGKWFTQSSDRTVPETMTFSIDKDSLIVVVPDEHGEMDTSDIRYSSTPRKSGSQRFYFEKISFIVDVEGDTIEITNYITITNVGKNVIDVHMCEIKSYRTSRHGNTNQWTKEFSRKYTSINPISYSVNLKLNRKRRMR